MDIIRNLLLILAALCFIVDAVGWPVEQRLKLTPLGLFFWVLNNLITIVPK